MSYEISISAKWRTGKTQFTDYWSQYYQLYRLKEKTIYLGFLRATSRQVAIVDKRPESTDHRGGKQWDQLQRFRTRLKGSIWAYKLVEAEQIRKAAGR